MIYNYIYLQAVEGMHPHTRRGQVPLARAKSKKTQSKLIQNSACPTIS